MAKTCNRCKVAPVEGTAKKCRPCNAAANREWYAKKKRKLKAGSGIKAGKIIHGRGFYWGATW